jgi:hypothetical protein
MMVLRTLFRRKTLKVYLEKALFRSLSVQIDPVVVVVVEMKCREKREK